MLYWYKQAETKTASTNFTWLCFVFPNSFVFSCLNSNICNLFMCLVFDGLLQSIYFRIFCSKHSITFDTYLLSCPFHCIDIFYINFRSCETFTISNSGAILLLIETPFNFKSFQRITEILRIIFSRKRK